MATTTRRRVTQKKKTKPLSVRLPRSMEEKHVGIEPIFADDEVLSDSKFYDGMRHYNYFYSNGDAIKWVEKWMRINRKEDLKYYKAAESWKTDMQLGAVLKMEGRGAKIGTKLKTRTIDKLNAVIESGKAALKDRADTPPEAPKKPVQQIMRERGQDFIANVEEVLDLYTVDTHEHMMEYSVFNELVKVDLSYNGSKLVYDYYEPLLEELNQLVKKDEDLVEAYAWLKPRQRTKYRDFVAKIVTDTEMYMNSKKAVRKVYGKKPKSADSQVSKVTYQKSSPDHKVTSIDPANVVGAKRVYLFHTKERMLRELVSRRAGGFEITGTTIRGIDKDVSRSIRLRKPEEFLPIVLKKTVKQIDKGWKELTTVEAKFTGRINKDTIILRALDK